MYDHTETALKCRDLAVMIEEARDKEITTEWNDLLALIRKHYTDDHPDYAERVNEWINSTKHGEKHGSEL